MSRHLSSVTGNRAHDPVPLQGSARRDRDGEPADLFDAADYPVRAVCKVCAGSLITWSMYAPFEHEERDGLGTSRGA